MFFCFLHFCWWFCGFGMASREKSIPWAFSRAWWIQNRHLYVPMICSAPHSLAFHWFVHLSSFIGLILWVISFKFHFRLIPGLFWLGTKPFKICSCSAVAACGPCRGQLSDLRNARGFHLSGPHDASMRETKVRTNYLLFDSTSFKPTSCWFISGVSCNASHCSICCVVGCCADFVFRRLLHSILLFLVWCVSLNGML